jgi:hypothetical protein
MAQKTILFSLAAGSTLYGLNTSGSDVDHRGVFVGVEPNIYRRGEVDSLYLRLDRALKSVEKSTQTLEMFCAPLSKFNYVRGDFYALAMGPMARNLIDSAHLYESYESYVIKHIEIGAGLRLPKKADAKNNLLFSKYGYVPKGFVHAIRAAMQVTEWLKNGFNNFPSDFNALNPVVAEMLRDVKENSASYKKDSLLNKAASALAVMKDARHQVKFDRVPNPEYGDFLLKMFGQQKYTEEITPSI